MDPPWLCNHGASEGPLRHFPMSNFRELLTVFCSTICESCVVVVSFWIEFYIGLLLSHIGLSFHVGSKTLVLILIYDISKRKTITLTYGGMTYLVNLFSKFSEARKISNWFGHFKVGLILFEKILIRNNCATMPSTKVFTYHNDVVILYSRWFIKIWNLDLLCIVHRTRVKDYLFDLICDTNGNITRYLNSDDADSKRHINELVYKELDEPAADKDEL